MQPFAKRCVVLAMVVLFVPLAGLSGAEPSVVRAVFDSDPQWDGFRNQLQPPNPPRVRQDFGYRATNRAGGAKAGEIGGRVQRSPTPAFYAWPIKPRSLDERLSAEENFRCPWPAAAAGCSSVGFRLRPPPGELPIRWPFASTEMAASFGHSTNTARGNWHTGGGGAFEGEQYQRTPTPPFRADGRSLDWSLDYDPNGAEGRGEMTFRIDGRTYQQALAPGHRADGAKFDHFGIWNVQIPGDALELYLDDLVIDGREFAFDADPKWRAEGTQAEFVERFVRPNHDFGYSATKHVDATPGEIGGVIFRDERPAYYGARTERLSLERPLRAAGKFALLSGASDSGTYLGWFDSKTKRDNETPEHQARQKNYLALMIEGPSRVGHYVRPAYGCTDGQGMRADESGGVAWPVIVPDGTVHAWAMDFDPQAAEGQGRISMTLDGQSRSLDLRPGDKQRGASFDRFGLFNLQSGGHAVEIYVDDLSYTAR